MGGNIKTAITRGFASAAVEYFTERFGTGERFAKLFSNPVSTRSFLKEFMDSMVAEGVEEIPGWITDNLTDQMMVALSQESLRYTELYQQYLEENGGDQAKADQAANDQIGIEGFGQLFEQMLSAAIAGGFGSGVVNIAGHINIDHAVQDMLNNNPGLDPAFANTIASEQTGWAPPKSILNQLVEKYQSGSAAQDRSVTNSGLNNTESGWISVQATRTADMQEDAKRNILSEAGQTKDSDAPAENGNIQPPAQNDIECMEQLESNNDYAGAASLRYNALMNSLKDSAAGVEALAADEGAVSMAAQMLMDAAMAQNSGTVIDPEARAKYEQAAQEVLGVKADAITQFASFLNDAVNTSGSVSRSTDLTGALSTVVNMKDAALRQVLDAYVSGGNLDLPAAQTLYTLMQLREAVLGTASDADVIIQEALLQLTSDALKSADVNSGNPELDDALVAAASSPHNLHAIQELWGMDGVNYAVNLIQSGHVKEALLLAALPSYSRAVIVAEENMKNVTLNQDAILAQENATAQDMQDPFIVKYAEGQAKEQAIYAFGMDLTSQGEDLPGYKKEAANAKDNWNTSKAALNRAIQAEQKASNALSQAQAKFRKDNSDPVAADAVVAAHQRLMEASAARKNAEKAFEISQQALTGALKNLDGAQQLARASVNAKARQSYEAFLWQRAQIRENEQGVGQTGEQKTVPPEQPLLENVSNEGKEGDPLAQGNGRGIMGEGAQGENTGGAGEKGEPDGQTAEDVGKALTKPYVKNRPKYGLNQVDVIWNAHVDVETGTAVDPSGAIIIWDRTKPRSGQWDMGHKPDQKYSDIHSKYMNGEISLDEFLKWYRNPENYRPELLNTNRSHLYEIE